MTRYIDDVATVYITASQFSTGASFDATGSPAYRIYEGTTDTPIQTGSFAALDDANTTGLYAFSTTLSTANGYEVGKTYLVYATATVDGVTAHTKAAEFVVRANPATESGTASAVWDTLRSDYNTDGYTNAKVPSMGKVLVALLKILRNKTTFNSGNQSYFDDDSATSIGERTYTKSANGYDSQRSIITDP